MGYGRRRVQVPQDALLKSAARIDGATRATRQQAQDLPLMFSLRVTGGGSTRAFFYEAGALALEEPITGWWITVRSLDGRTATAHLGHLVLTTRRAGHGVFVILPADEHRAVQVGDRLLALIAEEAAA